MSPLKIIGATAALAIVLTGCSGGSNSEEPAVTPTYVAEQLECSIFVEDEPTSPELKKTYTCASLDGDGPTVFMYEAESNEKLNEWIDSGALEVGPTDVVYGLDNLAVLAMDNAEGIEKQLEELFGPPIS